jgi:hypothetical protein
MKVGRIKVTETFQQLSEDRGQLFDGIDVRAEYLDPAETPRTVSFHFPFYTNNVDGLVRSVLQSRVNSAPAPEGVSNLSFGDE